ncbi:MAG TPA: hypothetical protein VF138_06785 [Caulobacteraceae bacterium]
MKLGPDALADRPIGPQILISGASARTIDNDGWYSDVDMTSYSGEVPDYVLGTDWTRPVAYDSGEAYVEYVSNVEETRKAPAPATPAVYTHPIKKPKPKPIQVSYPSQDGDILAGLHDGWPRSEPQVVEIDDPLETEPS